MCVCVCVSPIEETDSSGGVVLCSDGMQGSAAAMVYRCVAVLLCVCGVLCVAGGVCVAPLVHCSVLFSVLFCQSILLPSAAMRAFSVSASVGLESCWQC